MVVQPFSTAEQMAPLLMLLQEQICASAGSAVRPAGFCAGTGAAISGPQGVSGSGRAVEHHLQPGAVVVGVTGPSLRPSSLAPSSVTTSFFVDLTTFVDE